MKKIKVITLLNKIANGEDLPDKIKFDGTIFELQRFGPIRYTTDNLDLLEDCILEKTDLLEEVEIIEEEPEIDIQGIEETNELLALKLVDMRVSTEENLKRINKAERDMFYKLIEVTRKQNKMLKAIKQLDKKLKGE